MSPATLNRRTLSGQSSQSAAKTHPNTSQSPKVPPTKNWHLQVVLASDKKCQMKNSYTTQKHKKTVYRKNQEVSEAFLKNWGSLDVHQEDSATLALHLIGPLATTSPWPLLHGIQDDPRGFRWATLLPRCRNPLVGLSKSRPSAMELLPVPRLVFEVPCAILRLFDVCWCFVVSLCCASRWSACCTFHWSCRWLLSASCYLYNSILCCKRVHLSELQCDESPA